MGPAARLAQVDRGVRRVALSALGEPAEDRQVGLQRHLSVHRQRRRPSSVIQ